MTLKGICHEGGHAESPRGRLRLGFAENETVAACSPDGLLDREPPRGLVDVIPLEAEHLSWPEAQEQPQDAGGFKPVDTRREQQIATHPRTPIGAPPNRFPSIEASETFLTWILYRPPVRAGTLERFEPMVVTAPLRPDSG